MTHKISLSDISVLLDSVFSEYNEFSFEEISKFDIEIHSYVKELTAAIQDIDEKSYKLFESKEFFNSNFSSTSYHSDPIYELVENAIENQVCNVQHRLLDENELYIATHSLDKSSDRTISFDFEVFKEDLCGEFYNYFHDMLSVDFEQIINELPYLVQIEMLKVDKSLVSKIKSPMKPVLAFLDEESLKERSINDKDDLTVNIGMM